MGTVTAETTEELVRRGLLAFEIPADPSQVAAIATFIGELERWNRRINLVGLKSTPAIVKELIYDTLFLFTRIGKTASLLDLGSGAGVVAVPVSILDPGRHVYSLDKNLKKVQFQRHVKRLLNLSQLELVYGRVEEIPALHVDCLVAKAFGPVTGILQKAARHLEGGAYAYLVRGKSDKSPVPDGFSLENAEHYDLPGTNKEYQLLVYKKVP
jgi:16S rRNA (guanine527-N7)-methyltransferase